MNGWEIVQHNMDIEQTAATTAAATTREIVNTQFQLVMLFSVRIEK